MQIPLTVIGIDAQGHVFRERTLVQGLDGCDCQYQSKYEVRVNSMVLLDLDYTGAGQGPCRVQGRVKSLRTPQTDQGLFQIDVELDTSQSVRLVPHGREGQVRKQETPTAKPPVAATELKGMAAPSSPWREPAPQERARADAFSQTSTGPEATTTAENHQLLARIETQNLAIARETAKAALATEMSDDPGTLRNSLSCEIEKSVQAAVVTRMERMIHDAVEKQMAPQYQAGIQLLPADLTHQLAGRLSESKELRTCFEDMAVEMAERLSELLQTAVMKIEKDLNTRVIAIRQLIEEVIAEMQGRSNDTRANLGSTLTRAQAVDKEVNESIARVQAALAQLRDADRAAAERLAECLPSQLDAWSAKFDKRLYQITVERTSRGVSDFERQILPCLQRADATLETLAAGLELAQMQQGRLAELSRTATADLEKEIRALFLRLSSDA